MRRDAFKAAFPYTIPIFAGFWFLGLAYGIYMNVSGFSFVYPMIMSLVIFGGSLEFVAVSLMLSPFAPLQTLVVTLMIQARHLFYGISMLDKYKDMGLEILDFPCNQFGHQAPGTEEEIQEFCSLKYKTTFPLFAKIEVNGKNAEPLFEYLKKQKGGILGNDIKWNFTKFLVSREGTVVERYAPVTKPEKIERDILELL